MMRYINQAGDYATMHMGGTEGDPLPQALLDRHFQNAQEAARRDPNRAVKSFKGVFYVRGTVPADKVTQLANDPLVFIADITPNIVRQELAKAGIPGAEQTEIGIFNSLDNSGGEFPFWDMEQKYGLDKFQK